MITDHIKVIDPIIPLRSLLVKSSIMGSSNIKVSIMSESTHPEQLSSLDNRIHINEEGAVTWYCFSISTQQHPDLKNSSLTFITYSQLPHNPLAACIASNSF
jgi:hypothetical protein